MRRTVFVTNGSDQELECKAYIKYEGADAEGRVQTEAQAVVSKQNHSCRGREHGRGRHECRDVRSDL